MSTTYDIVPRLLSTSAAGEGIQVAATSTPGTLIHTATASPDMDEVTLLAVNISATAVKLTIEWSGAGTAQNIEQTIPGESGLVMVIPGLRLSGGLTVKAFAGTTAVITIFGNVNRVIL